MDREVIGTPGSRLQEYRKHKRLTQKELGEKIGLEWYQIKDLESGKVKLSPIIVKSLVAATDIREQWLLNGEGPMRREVATEVRENLGTYQPSEFVCIGPEGARDDMPFKKTFILIKHVTGKISAGQGSIPDNEVKAEVAFRKDWVSRKGGHENMSMISVKGDSMEPTLYNGDVVLVDHSKNYVEPQGGLYAISVDDNIMIKRLEVLPEAGKLRIISDNPKYGPREVDTTLVIINGKVIWFGRELER